ncbi:MAG: nucleotide exchange factor GrpE [Candidatus Saccharimonadales bacterium]
MSKQPKAGDMLQQIGELTEALQRERADATNLRRRHEEQLASLQSMAKASVVRDLLPVIDSFERALKHTPTDLDGNDYVKGIKGIVKQFEQALEKLGVQKIKTVGEPFNPHLHEAVSVEDNNGDHEEVSEELQPGYQMGDETLRPAMVRVRR